MRIRAMRTEHGRVAGQDYSVRFDIGTRLIAARHAKFINTEGREPAWRPAEPLCVKEEQPKAQEEQRALDSPPQDKMVRGPQVRKGAA